MRSFACTTLAAVIGFAVGWSAIRWSARPSSIPGQAALSGKEEIASTAASPDSAAAAAGETTKERMGAVAAILNQRGGMARDHALTAALQKLEAADFPAGADTMLALLKPLEKPFDLQAAQLADAWMDRWLELDAPGALRFLRSSPFLSQLPPFPDGEWPFEMQINSARGGIFQALARRQPEWTGQTLTDLDLGSERAIGLYALLSEVGKGDPTRAQQLLASFAEAADRPAAMTGYVTGLVAANVHAGFDTAWAEPPGLLRENLLRLVFNRASEHGESTVRELLDRIDDPEMRRKQAANAVAALGFEGRADALPLIKEESERMAATSGWKSEDARDWVMSVEVVARGPQVRALAEWAVAFAPDTDRRMLEAIAGDFAARQPAEFQSWLREHAGTLGPDEVKSLNEALRNLARGEPGAAGAWSETLPPGTLRDQARFQIALAVGAEGDLANAGAAYRSVAASDPQGALAGQLARLLADKDGPAAADWVTKQPAGPARTAALATVAEIWSARDPVGAAQWLDTMPAGAERDTAVQKYATQAVVADPESAAQWAEQVADPTLRLQTAEAVFHRWHIQNPVAARAWLRSLPGMEASGVAKSIRNTR